MNEQREPREESQLFRINDKPLQFYFAGLDPVTFYRYARKIEDRGAEWVESPDENTINLMRPESKLTINSPYEFYDVKYIDACIEANDMQFLEPYRIPLETTAVTDTESTDKTRLKRNPTDSGEYSRKLIIRESRVVLERINVPSTTPAGPQGNEIPEIIPTSSNEDDMIIESPRISKQNAIPSNAIQMSNMDYESATSHDSLEWIDTRSQIQKPTTKVDSKVSEDCRESKQPHPVSSKSKTPSISSTRPRVKKKILPNIKKAVSEEKPRMMFGMIVRERPLPSSSSDEEADTKIDKSLKDKRLIIPKNNSSIAASSRLVESTSDDSDFSIYKPSTSTSKSIKEESIIVSSSDGENEERLSYIESPSVEEIFDSDDEESRENLRCVKKVRQRGIQSDEAEDGVKLNYTETPTPKNIGRRATSHDVGSEKNTRHTDNVGRRIRIENNDGESKENRRCVKKVRRRRIGSDEEKDRVTLKNTETPIPKNIGRRPVSHDGENGKYTRHTDNVGRRIKIENNDRENEERLGYVESPSVEEIFDSDDEESEGNLRYLKKVQRRRRRIESDEEEDELQNMETRAPKNIERRVTSHYGKNGKNTRHTDNVCRGIKIENNDRENEERLGYVESPSVEETSDSDDVESEENLRYLKKVQRRRRIESDEEEDELQNMETLAPKNIERRVTSHYGKNGKNTRHTENVGRRRQIQKTEDMDPLRDCNLPSQYIRPNCWIEGGELVFNTDLLSNPFDPKFDYSAILHKKKFRRWEHNELIRYLYYTKNFHRSGSINVWQEMKDDGFLPHRSAVSILQSFKKIVKPSFEEFVNNEELRNEMLKLFQKPKRKTAMKRE